MVQNPSVITIQSTESSCVSWIGIKYRKISYTIFCRFSAVFEHEKLSEEHVDITCTSKRMQSVLLALQLHVILPRKIRQCSDLSSF